jgi:hypothetical protein
VPVADEERGRGQRGDARSDEIRGLLVHALRLAGTGWRWMLRKLSRTSPKSDPVVPGQFPPRHPVFIPMQDHRVVGGRTPRIVQA